MKSESVFFAKKRRDIKFQLVNIFTTGVLVVLMFTSCAAPFQTGTPTLTWPKPTAMMAVTSTPDVKTPSLVPSPMKEFVSQNVTILGVDYATVAPLDGKTDAGDLATENGVAQDKRTYFYTTIDNQRYLVDTYNGERDMVWQNGMWHKVEDAGVKFGYLLKMDDSNSLNKLIIRRYPGGFPATARNLIEQISTRFLLMRWTGNIKKVHITDEMFKNDFPNGTEFLALQMVMRLGKEGKTVSFWLAVALQYNDINDHEIFAGSLYTGSWSITDDGEQFMTAIGSPGENLFRTIVALNPTAVTQQIQYNLICDQLQSVLTPEISDINTPQQACRMLFDHAQTSSMEAVFRAINDGTITQEQLDNMQFISGTSSLEVYTPR